MDKKIELLNQLSDLCRKWVNFPYARDNAGDEDALEKLDIDMGSWFSELEDTIDDLRRAIRQGEEP